MKSTNGKKLGEVLIPTKEGEVVEGREILINEVYCEITKSLFIDPSFLPGTNVILKKLKFSKIQVKNKNKKKQGRGYKRSLPHPPGHEHKKAEEELRPKTRYKYSIQQYTNVQMSHFLRDKKFTESSGI